MKTPPACRVHDVRDGAWEPPCRIECGAEPLELPPNCPVAFIGIGVMGLPMAGHLASAGVELTVFNRTAARCEELRGRGVSAAANIGDALGGAAIVFTCVTDAAALRALLIEDDGARRVFERRGRQILIVDHSTIAPAEARALASDLARWGVRFVDAPVTGGQVGAQRGALSIMAGGAPEDIGRAAPFLFRYGSKLFHVGPVGTGQSVKAINQIVTAINHAALAEGVVLSERLGLPTELVIEALSGGAAGSWALQMNGPKLLRGDLAPGFRARDQLKDLRFALEESRGAALELPFTTLVTEVFARLVAAGHGELGNHALVRLFDEPS